jgi:hypothetical protein
MQWKRSLLTLIVCTMLSPLALAQRVTFGAVTGTQLTDDFRSISCPDLAGSTLSPPPGCPLAIGASRSVANASRALIVGPKVNIRLSPSLSIEVEALHRAIRSTQTISSAICLDPDCTTRMPYTFGNTGTEFTWEFPVLGRYQMSGLRLKPFVEGGPSFRPAENREQTGITTGGGVEIPFNQIRLTPSLRYTHWWDNGRYLGANLDQLQFVLGFDGPPSAHPVSVFGYKISLSMIGGMPLTDGIKTRTVIAKNVLIQDPVTRLLVPVSGTQIQNDNRTSPIVGINAEFALPKDLSLEFGTLWRPLLAQDVSDYSNGVKARTKFSVLTWEFPLLAKYKPRLFNTRPFFELGLSFRASGNLNGAEPSNYGGTAGVGLELRQGNRTIAPAIRFTHWAPDKGRTSTPLRRNQAELIFAVRF